MFGHVGKRLDTKSKVNFKIYQIAIWWRQWKFHNNILIFFFDPQKMERLKQGKYLNFIEIEFFSSHCRLFNFLNFMKARRNMTHTTLKCLKCIKCLKLLGKLTRIWAYIWINSLKFYSSFLLYAKMKAIELYWKSPCLTFCMSFKKHFSLYILLTDYIPLPDCLYFLRYRAACLL